MSDRSDRRIAEENLRGIDSHRQAMVARAKLPSWYYLVLAAVLAAGLVGLDLLHAIWARWVVAALWGLLLVGALLLARRGAGALLRRQRVQAYQRHPLLMLAAGMWGVLIALQEVLTWHTSTSIRVGASVGTAVVCAAVAWGMEKWTEHRVRKDVEREVSS